MAHGRRRVVPGVSNQIEQLEDRTLLSTSIPLSTARWVPIGPSPLLNSPNVYHGQPASGWLNAVAGHPSDPATIYVASLGGGIWKTEDGGASWVPLTEDQPTLFMGAVAVALSNPEIVYAGTGIGNVSSGVLKSSDAGGHWTLLGTDVFQYLPISKIVVHPMNPELLYVATGGGGVGSLFNNAGVWKSTDGGLTWSNTTAAIENSTTANFSDLIMDPSNSEVLFAAIGSTGGADVNGVYETTDGGANWTRLGGGLPSGTIVGYTKVATSAASPQTLYVSITGSGQERSSEFGHLFKMMKSTDGGSTWSELTNTPNFMKPQGWRNNTLIVDRSNANVVFAGGTDNGGECGIIKSNDGGDSWTCIATDENGDGPHTDHNGIALDAAGRVLDANDGGLWRLDDPAVDHLKWTNLNGNLQTTLLTGIALHPTRSDIAYAGLQDNGTLEFTDNVAWQSKRGGDGGFVRVDPENPETVYHEYQQLGDDGTAGTGFLERSDDGGSTWTAATAGINPTDRSVFYIPYVVGAANSSRLLLGTNRVYESINRGDYWVPLSSPGRNGWTADETTVIESVAAAATNVKTIYALAGGHVFVTTDHGATWIERNPVLAPPSGYGFVVLKDVQVDSTDSRVTYVVADNYRYYSSGGLVWRTIDSGVTWTDVSSNLPDVPIWTVELDPRGPGFDDDVLYVGTYGEGVYVSYDLGGSWSRFADGLPNVWVYDLELNRSQRILGAGTYGRGLWEILVDPPPVSFTSASSKGRESVGHVALPVTLPTAVTERVTVKYAVTGGTAQGNGVDYDLPDGMLTFEPGETEKEIDIEILSDNTDEPNETIEVTLSEVTNGQLGSISTHTYTILSNRGGVLVSPTQGLFTTAGGRSASFVISLTYEPTDNVIISLTSSNPAAGTPVPSQLTLTPADALTPHVVSVLGGSRNLGGNVWYSIITSAAASNDPAYAGLEVLDVSLVHLALLPRGQGTFADEDGDRYTVRLTGRGDVSVLQNDPDGNGRGPMDQLILTSVNSTSSRVAVTVQKAATGDGTVTVGSIEGAGLRSLTAPALDLTGTGLKMDGYLGSLSIRDIVGGADVIAGGRASQLTLLRAHVIGDGTTIDLASSISSFTAVRFGKGLLVAPSVGTLQILGDPLAGIAGDFLADMTLTGSIPTAIRSARINGSVTGSTIQVWAGNVQSFSAGAFIDSTMFLGQNGVLNPASRLTTFVVTGLPVLPAGTFANSRVSASSIGAVTLASVATGNGGRRFGFTAQIGIRSVIVSNPVFRFSSPQPTPAGIEDFQIELV